MFAFRKPRRAAATAVSAAVAAAVAAALLPAATAAARPAAGPPVPARYAAQKLAWQPCKEGTRLECAEMTVPRDWHHPGTGEDLRIAVSRVRASDPARRRGVLMTAAGGPGARAWNGPRTWPRTHRRSPPPTTWPASTSAASGAAPGCAAGATKSSGTSSRATTATARPPP
ncbi:hypothetical protein ACFQ2B_29670 [Streptomyces stramineus]